MPSRSALLNAWRILRRQGLWRQIAALASLMLIGVLDGLTISGLLPALSLVADSGGAAPSRIESAIQAVFGFFGIPINLGAIVLLLAALTLAKAIFAFRVNRYIGYMVAEIASDLRSRLIEALLRARWSYFTVNPVGRFAAAITSEANWSSQIYRTSLNIVAALIQATICTAMLLAFDWRVGLIGIAMAGIIGLASRGLIRRSRHYAREQVLAMRSIVADLNDVAAGFKPLKAMHRHAALMNELRHETKSMRRALRELVLLEQLAANLPELLVTAMIVAIAAIALLLFGMKLPMMAVAILFIYTLSRYVAKMQQALRESAQAEAAYESFAHLVRETEAAAEQFKGRAEPSLRHACRFEAVDFSYGRAPVLRQAEFSIPAGQITTLVGESGSGKTTIADLLLGLFVPDRGRISLDGVPLSYIDIGKWRAMIGYVPQETLLFNDTILANISLGDPRLSEADVVEALEMADAMGFVAELPNGLFSRVGDRGTLLSGGQRQRIALARALVTRPWLLILDEATSALDPDAEAEICATVARQRGRLTVLAITHQPAWVTLADHVYRLEDGCVRRLTAAERDFYLPANAAAGPTRPERIS